MGSRRIQACQDSNVAAVAHHLLKEDRALPVTHTDGSRVSELNLGGLCYAQSLSYSNVGRSP